jgi:NADH:ubiquinone oxidoreductase subunit 6 (subunit J)
MLSSKQNMKNKLKQLSYYLISILAFITILFTLWISNSPNNKFEIIELLPWFLWIASPYLILAILVPAFRESPRALRVSLIGIIIIGCVSLVLMIYAYLRNDHSGELWLFAPFLELVGCLLFLIIALIFWYVEKNKKPKSLQPTAFSGG